VIWARLLPPKNTEWSFVQFVMGKANYPRTLTVLMFAKNVGDLGSLKGSGKEI